MEVEKKPRMRVKLTNAGFWPSASVIPKLTNKRDPGVEPQTKPPNPTRCKRAVTLGAGRKGCGALPVAFSETDGGASSLRRGGEEGRRSKLGAMPRKDLRVKTHARALGVSRSCLPEAACKDGAGQVRRKAAGANAQR